MKRLRRISEKAATKMDEPKLSVAPLIDVCFLLLIFFMVTTTIEPSERDVTTDIGSEGETTKMDSLSVIIHIRGNGEIALNPGQHEILMSIDPTQRELPLLEDYLSTIMVGQDHPALMVRADGDSQHQRVVDVMNLLQKLRITRVGFVDLPEDW